MEIEPKSISIYANKSKANINALKDSDEAKNRLVNKTSAPAKVQVSSMAKHFSRALTMLEKENAPRPDVVEKGKETIKNWQDLSDEQIDKIMTNMMNKIT